MAIRISIITVCFNAEKVIERTLRSVTAQTYPEIEYIIIDGASSDGTLSLVRQLAPKSIIHSEKDRGIYDAMNKGLSSATGDYVWFLNAGDALPHADTVSTIVQQACTNGSSLPDVIYGDCSLIDHDGHVLGLRRLRPPSDLSWLSFRKGMLVCHQSFIAKRILCPKYDLQYRFSADVDWCIRVMKRAQTFYQISEPISLYLNEGATTKNHRKSLKERFRVMSHHYGIITTLWWHFIFLVRPKR